MGNAIDEQFEIVFEIGGEGGSISIYRNKEDLEKKFLYHHNEFDPTDEGLDVSIEDLYDSFEEPFQKINKKYSWFRFGGITIHEDYKDYVFTELILDLQMKGLSEDQLGHSKWRLEHLFNRKLEW